MYETFEHTADLGLRIRAADLPSLFREAAEALRAAIAEPRPEGAPAARHALDLGSERLEWLLFDWLGELLYLSDRDRVVLRALELDVERASDGWRLRAVAGAWPLASTNLRPLHEVKAITYHALRVERDGDAWLAEVVVDI